MIEILSFEREPEQDGTQQNGRVYPAGQSEETAPMTHKNKAMEKETS